MKLQNMTIIFIIIMIPIILVVSYYIGLQIKTIAIQNSYNTKLQTSAKDAIQALEINTVEWNSSASNLADSKRRDVLASINTFTTSLSNNLGISGAGKGRIQSYIPAIAYTMYDGYYIYSASLMKEQNTDTNGRTQFDSSDGNILYNGASSYEYVLKPYSPYSARYQDKSNNIDITVNYTLDNYIRVYGTIGSDYVTKEGYLVVPGDPNVGVTVTDGSISNIKYRRQGNIEPEELKENVHFIDDDKNSYTEEYIYIYDQNDNKLYWDNDNNKFFTINKDNKREFLQPALSIDNPAFSISNRFRKISVPYKDTTDGEWKIQKIFQILNPGGDFKFYTEDAKFYGDKTTKIGERDIDIKKDFSAINYCTESYVFTKWVNSKLKNITVGNMVNRPTDEKYNNVDKGKTNPDTNIFEITSANNPDPENDSAYETSPLAQHKKDVIINTLENNLAQATAEAQAANVNYDYRLPRLSYEEWEQALSNISIIAFMQGIPTGLKYYNNYAIATSTLNKEYVDPDELYFCNNSADKYYHQRDCSKITGSAENYTGYRSIDYVTKSYEESGKTKYYYLHNGKEDITKDNASLACYHCLVNRATYNKSNTTQWTNQYYKALARERYMQLDSPEGKYIPEVTKFTVTKNVDKPQVYYGDTITYTITVKNNSTNKKTNVLITDEFSQKLNDFININTVLDESGSSLAYTTGEKTIEITIPEIDVGAEKTIKIRGNIKGNVGNYSNVAKIIDSEKEFLSNQVTVNVIKDVTILATSIMPPANIVFIIDSSTSMVGRKIRNVQNAVKDFVNKMPNKGGSQIGYVKFYTVGFYLLGGFPYGSENGPYTMQQKDKFINKLEFGFDANPVSLTPFATGLKSGKKLIDKMKSINSNMNIAIFLSDGVNFSIEIPNYKQRAKELQSVTDRVYAIGYGTGVTNFETLRDDIASKKEYFKVGEDMDKVFKDIYDDIADINVDQNISGTTLIESAHYIDGTGNMSGKWIRLENDSDYNFKIDDENKMNGIEINTTKIRIKENEVAIGSNDGKTLVEWSGLGYIGKSSGSLYLNLSKFGPASKVEIEIVQ